MKPNQIPLIPLKRRPMSLKQRLKSVISKTLNALVVIFVILGYLTIILGPTIGLIWIVLHFAIKYW
jgi:hypothetical protein